MKARLLILGLTLAMSVSSRVDAATFAIGDLYNTGVDASHALLTLGSTDPNYTLVGPGGSVTPVAYTYGPPWVTNLPDAQWIAPVSGGTINGSYAYTTEFTLANDADLSTAIINGRFTADDRISDVILNGVRLGIGTVGDEIYQTWFNFQIDGSSPFQHGTNTLAFEVQNTHSVVTGLIVQMNGEYTTAAVPEPSSAILAGLGAGVGLALHAFRRRSRAAAA